MVKRPHSWRELFAVDARTLAAFRIALGALVVCDILDRARDFTALYTDAGVLGAAAGPAWSAAVLFFGAAAAGAALCAGRRSRLAALAGWGFTLAIQRRYPLTASGGDRLISMLLFWSAFAPLERRRGRVLSVGTVCLLGQALFIHWFSGERKTSAPWLDLSAVQLALRSTAATVWGARLAGFPGATRTLAWLIPRFEAYGSLLLFAPVAWLRLGLVAGFALMHASFGLCLDVANFPWASAAAVLLFVPGRGSSAIEVPSGRSETALSAVALGAFLAACGSAAFKAGAPLPAARPLHRAASALGLGQAWGMFVEAPGSDPETSGVAVYPDGRREDILRTSPREGPWASGFKDRRWRAYWRGLAELHESRPLWDAMTDYVCRRGARRLEFFVGDRPLERRDCEMVR